MLLLALWKFILEHSQARSLSQNGERSGGLLQELARLQGKPLGEGLGKGWTAGPPPSLPVHQCLQSAPEANDI